MLQLSVNSRPRNPWAWIPTLYLAEGMPYVLVTAVSAILYKDLGLENKVITFYTSLLGLPWVLKPLWSPAVDIYKTRRAWVWTMQAVIGVGLLLAAMVIPSANFLVTTLVIFFAIAACSATHDIAADGFYILANAEGDQTFFSGVRNAFYRLAMIGCQGGLLVLVGMIARGHGFVCAWQTGFVLASFVMVSFALYHRFILPRPAADLAGTTGSVEVYWRRFFGTFGEFFRKRQIVIMLLFLLTYRLGEVQLVKITPLFLKAPVAEGGLAITDEKLGVLNIISISALLLGGALGGILASRNGLRAWLWPMVIILHVPDVVFVYLSRVQPQNLGTIGSCLALEQFGYGFGFSAYMLYMLYMARGEHATAHYAICTGFMALGQMVPAMWSGWLQEYLGYEKFFVWVLVAAIPGCVMTALIPLERNFGRKTACA